MKICKHKHQEATCPFCSDKEGRYCDCVFPTVRFRPPYGELSVCFKCSKPIPDGIEVDYLVPGLDEAISTNKNKPKMLFVDDDIVGRVKPALAKYKSFYDIDIATCVPRALRLIIGNEYDVISLDFDLNGYDFQDPDDKLCGMEIVRYITKCGYPSRKRTPEFWIHSTNLFGANLMAAELSNAGFRVREVPFGWKKYQSGVIAGAFDVIHPGYVSMLQDAKSLCHKLTILVHNKPKQIFSLNDRIFVLRSIRYVDDVSVYSTEEELTDLFMNGSFDVRIVGNDHKDETSRPNLPFPTHYHERNEGWSATKYKKMIFDSMQEYKHNPRIA